MEFTEREQYIFDLLRNVVEQETPNTVLRIAGGFVRDKILGRQSNDIDIAVSNKSGLEFAKDIEKYLIGKDQIVKISVVKSNPDQSKHLECCIVKIDDVSIDFTNLRKETYADSRIPQTEIGTPKEDAYRRDFTINSLFYNLNTNQVEDFTECGLADLKNEIIRTPLDPEQTFFDDPLRICRSAKFASRYNFALTSSIIKAANMPKIQEALRTKVSQERIWKELSDALSGPNPVKAGVLIGELGLRDILFKPAPEELDVEFTNFDLEQNSPHHDLTIWKHTLAALKDLDTNWTTPEQKLDVENYLVRNLSMLLHDIGKCSKSSVQINDQGFNTYKGHECDSGKISEWALRKLKAPTNIIERVKKLCEEHMRLHGLEPGCSDRTLRRFIRELGSDWRNSCDLAIADSRGKILYLPNVHEKYLSFKVRMEELEKDLSCVGNNIKVIRPITGEHLKSIGIPQGPRMGLIFKALDEQLLETPAMSENEAIEFVKSLNF